MRDRGEIEIETERKLSGFKSGRNNKKEPQKTLSQKRKKQNKTLSQPLKYLSIYHVLDKHVLRFQILKTHHMHRWTYM